MHLLVCGGAGYVGAHVALALHRRGHSATVLDNLSTGHREAVRWGPLFKADLLDMTQLDQAFASRRFDAVLHLCARSLVAESSTDPYAYYENNVQGTLNLLRTMRRHGVDKIVFSSTAAVYGQPETDVIGEDHPKSPINPYGASKLMVERILADAAHAYGLRSVSLRYFNAAGSAHDQGIGESHSPETHLIPNVLLSITEPDKPLRLYGLDYRTPDGTCIRDYVHTLDLADAHLGALEFLQNAEGAHAFNLGNGTGFSVMEVIQAAERVTGRPVRWESAPRRAGDPPILVASSQKARTALGWAPALSDIDQIVSSAWRWHLNRSY
ncbi:UDP-glucose 4-epimerase GalE [Pseudoxanthomonas broegbernensis]|uniref:UDP-glucose 4-epimerase n=1 Tax=Pseudoxanthomonas broegbernensis TaxID=83619 RepID=A0A7V8K5S9_9GAMM|nr:UDP-glucose 4-epimerase GalE [Pseudoxanthomonas broegbernensis]KAF1684808.1 UDP-glucose 4-epimerase GalE [Pseudoxanthomonas broegbernensis]MBB6066333.1 UDP-glucose 4-epimerase [Pseudoxanthomonas broegbernensis]